MAKSLGHLLIKVNHAIVANFKVAIYLLRLFAKIKFSRKLPNLHYHSGTSLLLVVLYYLLSPDEVGGV